MKIKLIKLLFFCTLFLSNLVFAKECLNQSDSYYFILSAIKSEMMLTSIQCHLSKDYNQSMNKYPIWHNNYLEKWFNKHGSNNNYIKFTTQLANIESFSDIHLYGNEYCDYHNDIMNFNPYLGDIKMMLDKYEIKVLFPMTVCKQ